MTMPGPTLSNNFPVNGRAIIIVTAKQTKKYPLISERSTDLANTDRYDVTVE